MAGIRGNVETRLNKLDAGDYDAVVLAQAGLARLGLDCDRRLVVLRPPLMYPAVGQAALGLECRVDDEATITRLVALSDETTLAEVTAERACLRNVAGRLSCPGRHVGPSRRSVAHAACGGAQRRRHDTHRSSRDRRRSGRRADRPRTGGPTAQAGSADRWLPPCERPAEIESFWREHSRNVGTSGLRGTECLCTDTSAPDVRPTDRISSTRHSRWGLLGEVDFSNEFSST